MPQILSCSQTLFQVIRPDKCRPPSLINDIPWYSMHVYACRNLSYRLPVKSTFWCYLIVWFWCYQCDWCTLLFEPMAASMSALHLCYRLQPPWIVVMDFELLRTNLLWRTSELSFLAQKKHARHWKSCTELPKQLPWLESLELEFRRGKSSELSWSPVSASRLKGKEPPLVGGDQLNPRGFFPQSQFSESLRFKVQPPMVSQVLPSGND